MGYLKQKKTRKVHIPIYPPATAKLSVSDLLQKLKYDKGVCNFVDTHDLMKVEWSPIRENDNKFFFEVNSTKHKVKDKNDETWDIGFIPYVGFKTSDSLVNKGGEKFTTIQDAIDAIKRKKIEPLNPYEVYTWNEKEGTLQYSFDNHSKLEQGPRLYTFFVGRLF